MQLPSLFWSHLTTVDFSQLAQHPDIDRLVAVLPVAATEQHGPHLPVSVDATLLHGVISVSVQHIQNNQTPVLFLPMQTIGKSNEHSAFLGTLTMTAATLTAVWMELGECVAKTGIKKMLLFNSHGGQHSVMEIVARDLRDRFGLLVYFSSWYQLPLSDATMALFSAEEHRFGIHAGDIETSMMLASSSGHFVRMDLAENFRSTSQERAANYRILGNGSSAKWGWQMQDYNPKGAAGNASIATAEKGHAVFMDAGQLLAELLAEISHLPMTTLKIPTTNSTASLTTPATTQKL